MDSATPESIQAEFDRVKMLAPITPLFKWAEIEDIEPIKLIYPPEITPDPIEWDGIETIKRNKLTKAK